MRRIRSISVNFQTVRCIRFDRSIPNRIQMCPNRPIRSIRSIRTSYSSNAQYPSKPYYTCDPSISFEMSHPFHPSEQCHLFHTSEPFQPSVSSVPSLSSILTAPLSQLSQPSIHFISSQPSNPYNSSESFNPSHPSQNPSDRSHSFQLSERPIGLPTVNPFDQVQFVPTIAYVRSVQTVPSAQPKIRLSSRIHHNCLMRVISANCKSFRRVRSLKLPDPSQRSQSLNHKSYSVRTNRPILSNSPVRLICLRPSDPSNPSNPSKPSHLSHLSESSHLSETTDRCATSDPLDPSDHSDH